MKKLFIVMFLFTLTAAANAQSAERVAEAIVGAIFGDSKQKDTHTHKTTDAGGQVAFNVPKEILSRASGQWYSWEVSESSKAAVVSSTRNSAVIKGKYSTSSTVINYKYKVREFRDGREKEETVSFPFTLTVNRVEPTAITIDQETTVGWGVSSQLHPKFTPEYSEAGTSFDSDNTNIVTVSANGVVTGQQLGSANIIIRTENGLQTQTHITCVIPPVSKIQVVGHDKKEKLYPGDEVQLSFNYAPEHAQPQVRWYSSDSQIATVDENGLVKILDHGTVHIYCEDKNGAKNDIKLKPKKLK